MTEKMTEKEKAAAGMSYNGFRDDQLRRERQAAQRLLDRYNRTGRTRLKKREKILRSLVGQLGQECVVEQPFYCDFGYNTSIGDHFFSNVHLVILDCARVTIGNHVFIGPNVGLYTASHPFDVEARNRGDESAHPITIGDNVWIGGHVCVMPGVTIGSNAVIGAGSVVTRDIPDGVLAYGNPCRVVRSLLTETAGPEIG